MLRCRLGSSRRRQTAAYWGPVSCVLEDVQAIEGPNKRSRSTPASGASVLQLGVILALAPSHISLPRYPYRVGLNIGFLKLAYSRCGLHARMVTKS